MLLHVLAQNWWLLLLRGLLAIAFGILTFAWPGITLLTLIIFYGCYALVDGVISLVAAFRKERPAPMGWLILVGVLGIAAGLLSMLLPGVTALVLLFIIAGACVARGILEIVGAIQLRKEIEHEWLLILSGIVSVIFGALILISPGPGALVILWMIGAYAIAFGVLLVGFALRLRKHSGNLQARPA
jgi:uncharacterized membrane protein HdeD (DUF308 family)